MEQEENLDFQTTICANKAKTVIQITICAKTEINGQLLIDILSQLVDDYTEQPESIIDGETLTFN